jgi:glycosyltransferase involved in cell wall biosynthesis
MSTQLRADTVFVIIPFYNENTIILKVIGELFPFGYQLVVVDDGSETNPSDILKGNHPVPVHLLRHKVNLGQGAALQTGIDFSLRQGASYLVTFDADGQHSANDIQAMLLPLQNAEADITLGSSFLNKNLHNAPVIKQWILKTGRLVNYFFTGLYLSDAHNGLRAMTREAAGKIRLMENRMAHATEFLLAIKRNKLRYKEVPALVMYTSYSKSKGQSVFNSIRIFFDLVLHKLFE